MGWQEDLANKAKGAIQVPNGSVDDLKKGAAGALGGIFGKKAAEAAKPAVDGVNGAINDVKDAGMNFLEKAKLKTLTGVAVGRLPDALPLDGPNAKNFTTFVENGLNEGGYSKVKADGKPDKYTLDAVNDLRQKAGQAPLDKVGDFKKDDLKLVFDNLEKTENPRAVNVLKSAPDVLNGVRESGAFPEPVKPATFRPPEKEFSGG